jgi:hypothetical protein
MVKLFLKLRACLVNKTRGSSIICMILLYGTMHYDQPEPLLIALDTQTSTACRPKFSTSSMGRYCDQPDGSILSKPWVAALHVMTCGSELLQQHRQEGQPPQARPPADKEADLHLWLVENKLDPHSFKFGLANHLFPCRYSTQDRSLGRIFCGDILRKRDKVIKIKKTILGAYL